jgi:hypothetical protein
MSYNAEISRRNPSCLLFLVDRSASMEDPFGDGLKRKCEGLAEVLNRLLYELAIKCAKEEGIRNYYDVGVIGYGATVESAFTGALAGRSLVPIADVANHPARLEERAKALSGAAGSGEPPRKTIRVPVWFDPVAVGGTPMTAAFGLAGSVLRGWLDAHPDAFPPAVVHITDGESSDGDPTKAMNALTRMHSSDGQVLLFNVHISGDPNVKPLKFPDSSAGLPNAYARMLYANASFLTPFMKTTARQLGLSVGEDAKAFVLNADLALLSAALDIGTRASNPLR